MTISGTDVWASVADPERMPVPVMKSRRPSLSANLVHCLSGLAGVKTRLAVDVCDRRCRLWGSFPWRGFGGRRSGGAFPSSESLMLPPGLAGVHSREFPGQWWVYESLRGFASNRLTAEAHLDCLEAQLMNLDA